ncbi:helix-turn-helix domain-containing protein [Nonomuraea sp. NPDC050663]|uniref:ArsR/SmtB family transcription factor n=1 Tax=Nonomuraea sp. NPDC050663 TaxID=3364370 RepID=UPI0037AAAEFC
MIEYRLGPHDVARVRFGRSPMLELLASVRLLLGAGDRHVHRPWLQSLAPHGRRVLDRLPVLLADLRHVPEELLTEPAEDFEKELEGLGASLRDEVAAYWAAAIEPVWPRLRAVHDDDLGYRTTALATGGLAAVLTGLHPDVEYHDGMLRINKPQVDECLPARGVGVLLIPCVFGYPGLLAAHGDCEPTLVYAPRGVALTWQATQVSEPLVRLMGRNRAAILSLLDLPHTTTELAVRLGITAAAVSEHLTVLREARLVSRRRNGRSVLYQQTGLAAELGAGSICQ